MDLLNLTLKVFCIDISALVSKLFSQYIEVRTQSIVTSQKTKEISKLETAHLKILAEQEIEHKRMILLIEQSEKEKRMRIEFSKKLRLFLDSNGFKLIEENKSLFAYYVEGKYF